MKKRSILLFAYVIAMASFTCAAVVLFSKAIPAYAARGGSQFDTACLEFTDGNPNYFRIESDKLGQYCHGIDAENISLANKDWSRLVVRGLKHTKKLTRTVVLEVQEGDCIREADGTPCVFDGSDPNPPPTFELAAINDFELWTRNWYDENLGRAASDFNARQMTVNGTAYVTVWVKFTNQDDGLGAMLAYTDEKVDIFPCDITDPSTGETIGQPVEVTCTAADDNGFVGCFEWRFRGDTACFLTSESPATGANTVEGVYSVPFEMVVRLQQ